MFKTIRLMMVALLTMACGSMFGAEVVWEASSGDPLTTIYPDGNISLKWEEAGGDFAPKYSGGSVYFYNGNRVTVAGVSSDVTITKIVFTFTGEKVGLVTCDKSGKNESSAGITNDTETMTCTWEGTSGSLVFRASRQTGARYISSIAVTYTGGTTGPVVTAPKLSISNNTLADTYDMDESKVFVVYAKNDGNAAAQNARLAVLVDDVENTAWTIGTLAIGEEKWQNMKFDYSGLEAGEHNVVLQLTADDVEAATFQKTVTFTKKAPEASFQLSAQNVSVQLPVDKIDIPVTVQNTSDVDATDVKLNLWKNGVIATATIDALAAGESKEAVFTIEPLEAGTYEMQILTADNKYGCSVSVSVEAAPVEEVVDLAVTDITGTIELANETSDIRIIVENKGNVDVTNAPVTLKAGDKLLGTATVTVAAGQTGFCYVTVASEDLEAGELEVTATVEAEGDATPDNNTKTANLTVKDTTTAIQAIRAQYGETVQLFTLGGQKVNNVQKGKVYIVNGKKVSVK